MHYSESILELVGNTPLVRLRRVTEGLKPLVLAKIEYLNPGGSVKDRIGLAMVEEAERSGLLHPGGTIVEPTSGNTGVGLALVAIEKGYRCIFVMPDKMSQEKISLLRAYGAEVVVCPTAVAPDHPQSYYSVARRLVADTPGAWSPDQYSNPRNPDAHYNTTGPEIWRDTEGKVTHLVAGIGTGGTITGTGRYLKEQNPKLVVVGADPEGSVFSGGSGRPYLVEGVGEDFWPTAFDPKIVDRVVAVSDRDSFLTTRRLAREEGLLVGGSCGLAVTATLKVAAELDESAVMVVILPDSGRGYLSKIYNDDWMADFGFLVEASTEPLVGAVLARKGGGLPTLVHVHPDEAVGAAIKTMREYGVSQMPVVKEEPPLMVAEVIGSVSERDLLDAVFADRVVVDSPVGSQMGRPLPMVGAGEPLSRAMVLLKDSSGVIVLDDGKPVGILTRADLLNHLVEEQA